MLKITDIGRSCSLDVGVFYFIDGVDFATYNHKHIFIIEIPFYGGSLE